MIKFKRVTFLNLIEEIDDDCMGTKIFFESERKELRKLLTQKKNEKQNKIPKFMLIASLSVFINKNQRFYFSYHKIVINRAVTVKMNLNTLEE